MSTKAQTDSFFALINQLFRGNEKHVEEIKEELENHVDGQDPDVTSVVCCDSRVLQQEMWKNHVLGSEFSHGVIGNHVNTYNRSGKEVVSGSVDYIPEHSDTPSGIIVIGHTGCGAVSATYSLMEKLRKENISASDILEQVNDFSKYNGETEGINTDIALLLERGLAEKYEELKEADRDFTETEEKNLLVQANVDAQVEYLKSESDYPDHVEVYGAIYDMNGSFSGEKGQLYLTNYAGETSREALEEEFSNWENVQVERLKQ